MPVPAGENSKSLTMANNLYEFLADQQFTAAMPSSLWVAG